MRRILCAIFGHSWADDEDYSFIHICQRCKSEKIDYATPSPLPATREEHP